MKNIKKILAVIVTSCICLSAFSQDVTVSSADSPVFSQFEDVWTPEFDGRQFTMLSLNASSNFYIGCDGVGRLSIINDFENNIKRNFNYLKNNASGFAINYLVYENPTLYSFLDKLDKQLNLTKVENLATCKSIREKATSSRLEKNAKSIAHDNCLKSNSGDDEACNDGDTLRTHVQDYASEIQDERNQATGKNDAGVVDLILATVEPENINNDTIDLDFEKLITDLVVERKISSSGEEVGYKKEGRAKGLADLIKESSTKYRSLIERVTESNPRTVFISDAYKALENDVNARRMSPQFYNKLRDLKRNQFKDYQATVAVLARAMAISSAEYNIAKFEALMYNAFTSYEDKLIDIDDKSHMEEVIKLLSAELELYKIRLRNSRLQGDLARVILERM